MKVKLVLLIGGLLFMSSCATIVGDKTQLIGVKSAPDNVVVSVVDEKGSEVFKGNTPTSVTLQKADGSYFGGKTYNLTLSKDGYKPVTILLDTKVNGWYIGGNLVFGGLIGWLIVDPFTGAMYTIKPESIDAQLKKNDVTGSWSENGLHIVLLEAVPSPMRSNLIHLN